MTCHVWIDACLLDLIGAVIYVITPIHYQLKVILFFLYKFVKDIEREICVISSSSMPGDDCMKEEEGVVREGCKVVSVEVSL